MFPPHFGMRQYWRDFDSLERWARTDPHGQWWRAFIKDRGGTGFWHETYLAGGGVEAGYLDMPKDIGLSGFAPHVAKRGSMFSARRRLGLSGQDPRQARSQSRRTTPTSPVPVRRPPGSSQRLDALAMLACPVACSNTRQHDPGDRSGMSS
jgi:hypothetical protein